MNFNIGIYAKIGNDARNRALSPKRRSEIARKAAQARWRKESDVDSLQEEQDNHKGDPDRCTEGNCQDEEYHRYDCEHNKHGREDQEGEGKV